MNTRMTYTLTPNNKHLKSILSYLCFSLFNSAFLCVENKALHCNRSLNQNLLSRQNRHPAHTTGLASYTTLPHAFFPVHPFLCVSKESSAFFCSALLCSVLKRKSQRFLHLANHNLQSRQNWHPNCPLCMV